MKAIRIFFRALIILCGFQSCNRNANEIAPQRKDIIQAVYASGKITPLNRYTVISRSAGYVNAILVSTGDLVKSGQILLEIRNEQNELSISSAANQMELARQNADPDGPVLHALKQEMESSYSKYLLDSISLVRNRSLFAENACSRQQLDLAETQAQISRKNFQRSKDNLNAALDRFNVELKNANNLLEVQRSNRDDYKILSAINGRVYDIYPKPGDLVNLQTPLMEIGDSSQFEVELSIDETDIGLIEKDQMVYYTIDAYPDTVFTGKISEIIPHVQVSSKSSRLKATIVPIETKPFYSGMSVEANIVAREKKNCLVIPREFLHNGNQVKVKGESGYRMIRKGIEDLQNVEVISGLNEQDILVKE